MLVKVRVNVGVSVAVAVGVDVAVGVGLGVTVGVFVGVDVGVLVRVGVGVRVEVGVGVANRPAIVEQPHSAMTGAMEAIAKKALPILFVSPSRGHISAHQNITTARTSL